MGMRAPVVGTCGTGDDFVGSDAIAKALASGFGHDYGVFALRFKRD